MQRRLAVLICLAVQLQTASAAVDGAALLRALTFRIESRSSDAETALLVEHTDLSEQIGEEDVRWIERQGAGKSTVAALRLLKERSMGLPKAAVPVVSRTPRPSQQQVNELFLKAARYVSGYLTSLIDFTCQSRTECFLKQAHTDGPEEWKHRSTIREQISFVHGRERILDERGRSSWPPAKREVGDSWSSGEFSNTMRITFMHSNHARFAWDHWEVWNGIRTGVFEYSVPAASSQFLIGTQVLLNGTWEKKSLVSAYQGYIYVDAESGAILRLIANTSGIGSEYAINEGRSILDYSDVTISGKHFLLLSNSTSYVSSKSYQSLFEKSFRGYHRFEAESKMIVGK